MRRTACKNTPHLAVDFHLRLFNYQCKRWVHESVLIIHEFRNRARYLGVGVADFLPSSFAITDMERDRELCCSGRLVHERMQCNRSDYLCAQRFSARSRNLFVYHTLPATIFNTLVCVQLAP